MVDGTKSRDDAAQSSDDRWNSHCPVGVRPPSTRPAEASTYRENSGCEVANCCKMRQFLEDSIRCPAESKLRFLRSYMRVRQFSNGFR